MLIPGLIWDACTLLNLLATGKIEDILAVFDCQHYVMDKVWREEALYLQPMKNNRPDAEGQKEMVGFEAYLSKGLFFEAQLDEQEQESFVQFAVDVDDGEARTLAVALHRKLWIATDDRAAIKLAATLDPPVQTLKTLQWLQEWERKSSPDIDAIQAALRGIRIKARYQPNYRREAPDLCAWWDAHYPRET